MRRRHKYNVAPREERTRDGIVFDSKREMFYYDRLVIRKKAGDPIWWVRQPVFDLPGGVKYRADFVVFEPDRIQVVDVKGHRTAEYKLKKRQVEAIYGIEIVEV